MDATRKDILGELYAFRAALSFICSNAKKARAADEFYGGEKRLIREMCLFGLCSGYRVEEKDGYEHAVRHLNLYKNAPCDRLTASELKKFALYAVLPAFLFLASVALLCVALFVQGAVVEIIAPLAAAIVLCLAIIVVYKGTRGGEYGKLSELKGIFAEPFRNAALKRRAKKALNGLDEAARLCSEAEKRRKEVVEPLCRTARKVYDLCLGCGVLPCEYWRYLDIVILYLTNGSAQTVREALRLIDGLLPEERVSALKRGLSEVKRTADLGTACDGDIKGALVRFSEGAQIDENLLLAALTEMSGESSQSLCSFVADIVGQDCGRVA